MYSSSVWKDKPLFRIYFEDVEKVGVVQNQLLKNLNQDIKFHFQIEIKSDVSFKKSKVLENEEPQNDSLIEFCSSSQEIGCGFFNVLNFMLNRLKK